MYAAMDPKDINYSRMPKMISNLDHTLDSLKDLFNGSEFSYEDKMWEAPQMLSFVQFHPPLMIYFQVGTVRTVSLEFYCKSELKFVF